MAFLNTISLEPLYSYCMAALQSLATIY